VHPFSDGFPHASLSLRPGLRERAYSVPDWRAGGPAAQQLTPRDGRWRVCAALAIDVAASARFPGTYQVQRARECFPYTPRGSRTSGRATSPRSIVPPAIPSRCSRRSSGCSSGGALRPRCSTSKSGSGAGDAEREDELWFRSSGGGRAGKPAKGRSLASAKSPDAEIGNRKPFDRDRGPDQRHGTALRHPRRPHVGDAGNNRPNCRAA
jgi:hypothetical protein